MPSLPGREYCLFHDPEYWRENPDEVREAFYERVERALEGEKPLFCVGYHLPKIELKGKKFTSVYFNEAIFHEEAYFTGTEFDIADFSNAKFYGSVDFSNATFNDSASFVETKFYKYTSFEGAKFQGPVLFVDSEFREAVDFSNSLILSTALFQYVAFAEKPIFLPIEEDPERPWPIIHFDGLRFGPKGRLIFDGTDMSRVSFMFTDLSQHVEFRNVRWWEYEGAYVLADQILLILATNEKYARKYFKRYMKRTGYTWWGWWHMIKDVAFEDARVTLDNVLQEIRNLRDWHDKRMRYDEGGKFFISEMDTRRLVGHKIQIDNERARPVRGKSERLPMNPWNRLLNRLAFKTERFILKAYRDLCLYGESVARPIAWMIITVFTFALLYMLGSFLSPFHDILLFSWVFPSVILTEEFALLPFLLKFLKVLGISVLAFLQLQTPEGLLVVLERVLSIIINGGFVLALRRRLERRVRH